MHFDLEDERDWPTRERYWRQKLGRIRLDAEPVEDQVAKYQRVTWALSAVLLILSLIFVGLFSAFHRPDIGVALVGCLFLPIAVMAWVDITLLRARTDQYLREWQEEIDRRAASR
ncbi:hypothetical protein ACYOEI_25715 [Singulisphaera rosea]